MNSPIIESYQFFLDNVLNEQQASQGVAFISASTSESNITTSLAAKMGVKSNVKYKVETTSLGGFLTFTKNDGSKYGKSVKVTAISKVNPGTDYLSINGKVIEESGSFTLTKAELNSKVKIEAAGNGLLVLARLGDALLALNDFGGAILSNNVSNYIIKFSMGGSVDEKSSRGYKAYFSKPGGLTAHKNAMAVFLIEAAMIASGYKDRISKTDKIYSGYVKTIESMGNNIATMYPKHLATNIIKTNHTLVNLNPAAMGSSWSNIVANKDKLFTKSGNKLSLTKTGWSLLNAASAEIANAIAPTKYPNGFGDGAADIFKSYSSFFIKDLSQHNFPKWLDKVQTAGNWDTVDPKYAEQGDANKAQAEGQYGTAKTQPTASAPTQTPTGN